MENSSKDAPFSNQKAERNNKEKRAEHVYFFLSASGSLNWTHFLLHCEFIWIQSFEKIKSFSVTFFFVNRELILFTLFAVRCPKFKQGGIKRTLVSRFCILMLYATMWVGFLLPHFRSRASLPLPVNKVLSCAAQCAAVRLCKTWCIFKRLI